MRCDYPVCSTGTDIEPAEVARWEPGNFNRYGTGALELCGGCWWMLATSSTAITEWAREEAARRWPIGVDAARRRGESRERWIRRQARVYEQRTGHRVVVSRVGTFWTIGSKTFMPLGPDAPEAYITQIMDGDIKP